MKKNLIPLLGIAFLVAVLATGVFYGLIVRKLGGTSTPLSDARQMVVAARHLDRGTVLKATDLSIVPEPREGALPGASARVDDVVGLTVLEPIRENQPLTAARLSPRTAGVGASQAIPPGMRAVSAHIWDSSSVVAMLRSGDRVDLQLITHRPTPIGPEPVLRNVLQNVEVLHTAPPEPTGTHAGRPVLTLLVTAAEAEVVSLADSTGRLRATLRNRRDDELRPGTRLTPSALSSHGVARSQPRPAPAAAPSPKAPAPAPRPAVQFHVRVVQAGPAAAAELGFDGGGALRVSAMPETTELEPLLARHGDSGNLAILSESKLLAAHRSEVSLRIDSRRSGSTAAADGVAGVRLRFLPSVGSDGALRLRVHPEIKLPSEKSTVTRHIETELDLRDGQSFLVSGLMERAEGERLLPRWFPPAGEGETARRLLIVVTPRLRAPVETAAAKKGR